jgi:hypothetical protein
LSSRQRSRQQPKNLHFVNYRIFSLLIISARNEIASCQVQDVMRPKLGVMYFLMIIPTFQQIKEIEMEIPQEQQLEIYFSDLYSLYKPLLIQSFEKNFQVLDLSNSHLNELDAECIASFLIRNQSLLQLNLFGNRLGDRGVQALYRGLINNHHLLQLDIGQNNIRMVGSKQDIVLTRTWQQSN